MAIDVRYYILDGERVCINIFSGVPSAPTGDLEQCFNTKQ